MSPLANRLKALRARTGLSVAEVARRVNVAPSTYRDWEYGRSIKGEPYVKLAEIFGVTLSELLIGREADLRGVKKKLDEIERLTREIRTML
ncbi:MAG: helix-turn-helix transcriptional regulator [Bdellovibrionales bacterium]